MCIPAVIPAVSTAASWLASPSTHPTFRFHPSFPGLSVPARMMTATTTISPDFPAGRSVQRAANRSAKISDSMRVSHGSYMQPLNLCLLFFRHSIRCSIFFLRKRGEKDKASKQQRKKGGAILLMMESSVATVGRIQTK